MTGTAAQAAAHVRSPTAHAFSHVWRAPGSMAMPRESNPPDARVIAVEPPKLRKGRSGAEAQSSKYVSRSTRGTSRYVTRKLGR